VRAFGSQQGINSMLLAVVGAAAAWSLITRVADDGS
jgi:hypothetical protein